MSEWQPIETVEPRSRVLVYCPNEDAHYQICEAEAFPDGRFYDPCYSEWSGEGATHWMPLPKPPVQP